MIFFPKYHKQLIIFLFCLFTTGIYAYHTVNYNAKNGIVSNSVYKIFIDNTHKIWLGTDNGISCLTGNGIVNYGFSDGLTCNKIRNFAQTTDGRFWVSSSGEGIFELKNNRFINYKFTRSELKNQCSQMREYKGWLFISSEEGLDGLNLKTNKFYWFPTHNTQKALQGLRFFEWKDDLYVQTFLNGAYKVNLKTHALDSVRYEEYINRWNFNVTQVKDTFFLCRSKYVKKLHHNLFYSLTSDYIRGGRMDSIEISTLIWKMTQTPLGLMAACWGARDASGGLFLRQGKKMVNINYMFDLSSNSLRDVVYDEKNKKLYIATLDKGLYIYDLNTIITRLNFEAKSDILDLKIIGNKLFVLKKDTLSLYENGALKKNISIADVEKFIRTTKPNNSLRKIDIDASNRFLDLSVSANSIVINSNFTEVRLNLDLKFKDYIKMGSDDRLCFLKNDDALIIRFFGGGSELCDNFGKGKHRNFNYWNKTQTNPKEPTDFCKLNDTTFLVNTEKEMFIYYQHDTLYRRFEKLKPINLPSLNDRYGENSFVSIDKFNILYRGLLLNDSLVFNQIADLRKSGVIESYFVRSFNKLIVAATNKGVFILDKNKIYLVDKSYGLPDNIVLRTAQYRDGLLYIATSEGIYTIDIQKLKSISCDYHLSNLVINVDGKNHSFQLGTEFRLHDYPTEIMVIWELNNHPYPIKLQYSYRINNEDSWHKVLSLGQIRISEPNYGKTTIYLRIKDEVQNKTILIKLLTVNVVEPFYRQLWFIILLVILLVSASFILFYRIRIIRLKSKAQKAMEEKQHVQLKLDTLQFLLKPHFIFNALTSIQNLIIKKDMDKSLEYSGLFSKFLRGVMQNTGDEFISLQEELRNINTYIELEKLRFNADINVQISIAENIDPEKLKIIPFLFQPLLENTFKHAFTKDILQPQIRITVSRNAEMIEYRLSDNGIGLNGKTLENLLTKSVSKGLKITIAQLDKFYNAIYSFHLAEKTPQGVLWIINIPE